MTGGQPDTIRHPRANTTVLPAERGRRVVWAGRISPRQALHRVCHRTYSKRARLVDDSPSLRPFHT